MKKIKYITILLSGIFVINSCNTNDLKLSNPNELAPETFFKTEEQVQSSINACYANLQTHGLYSRHIFFALDNMSQENKGNPQLEGNKSPFLNFSFDGGSDIIQFFWEACYLGIAKTNFVLDNADRINALPEKTLSTAKKNKFLGEAHFMRAYYYFLLVNRLGDLPLYTSQTIEGKARSPKAEVYKLITDDFDFASKNLLTTATEQKGRATKEAAFAYLGKALLYQKNYAKALTAFAGVTGFSLEPKGKFYDNFMEETEHGPESVFEVEYDPALGVGDKWGVGQVSGTGAAEATFRGQEYGNLGWYNVYPSDDLLNEYEPGDNRFADTFYVPGSKYNNGNSTMRQDPEANKNLIGYVNDFGGKAVYRRAGWKKYQNYYKRVDENQDSGINFKVMRYSDVLLMKAECLAFQATPDFAGAIALIKEVRDRANLTTTIASNLAAVTKALIHERKVELAGEQVRFDDIMRWGNASTELIGSGFAPNKNELWPIPNRETSSNPNIGANNTGW
jgi:starch-binding outer membrane protein, SusD/RagB family